MSLHSLHCSGDKVSFVNECYDELCCHLCQTEMKEAPPDSSEWRWGGGGIGWGMYIMHSWEYVFYLLFIYLIGFK